MANEFDGMSLLKGVAAKAFLVCGLAGCATAPADQTVEITGTKPAVAAVDDCSSTTVKTGATAIFAAALGHVIDQKTGGGNGFEKALGKGTEAVERGCLNKTRSFPTQDNSR